MIWRELHETFIPQHPEYIAGFAVYITLELTSATMSKLFDLLNTNSGALSALFSGVVTVATIIYAWLTAKLVQETRQMRQVQTEPRIQITYRVRDEWINLIDIAVRNIGLGPAHDLKFEIHADTDTPGSTELVTRLMKLAAFKSGLSYMGPAQEYFSFWSSLVEGDSTKLDSRIVITCSYRSVTNIRYQHECVLDLSELKGSSRIGDPPLHKIAKHLEQIEKALSRLGSGSSRLKVDTFTQADRVAEREQIDERIRLERAARKSEL
jgi:hypothetical protein